MARYDSHVIYSFADELYARADLITIVYTGIGGLIGAFLGYMVSEIARGSGLLTTAIGLVVVGAIGYFMGSGKAFELRVQAQTLLCQVAIEENTRKLPGPAAAADRAAVPASAGSRQSPHSPGYTGSVSASILSVRTCPKCSAALSEAQQAVCPECGAPVELGAYVAALQTVEDDRVKSLLQRFQDPTVIERASAIKEVVSSRLSDQRITDALEILASCDNNDVIRKVARGALDALMPSSGDSTQIRAKGR